MTQKTLIKESDTKHKKKGGKGEKALWITGLVLLFLTGLALTFNTQIRDFMLQQNEKQSAQTLTQGAKNGDPTKSTQAKKNQKLNKLKAEYRNALKHGDKALAKKLKHEIDHMQPKGTTYNWSAVKPVSTGSAISSRLHRSAAGAVGDVAIPKAGLYLPINAGVGNWALSCGFGTFSSVQEMGVGNYPLAAHNLSTTGQLGAKLDYAHVGDNVYLTDLNTIYVYKIYHKGEFSPTATWVTNIDSTHNGQPVVVLITCHDWGSTREIVFGELQFSYHANKRNLRVFKNLYY